MIEHLLRGASITTDVCIAIFFLRFWSEKRDALFFFFALAFALMAVSTFVVVWVGRIADFAPVAYVLRLLAYVLIIFAIVNKNRPSKVDE